MIVPAIIISLPCLFAIVGLMLADWTAGLVIIAASLMLSISLSLFHIKGYFWNRRGSV